MAKPKFGSKAWRAMYQKGRAKGKVKAKLTAKGGKPKSGKAAKLAMQDAENAAQTLGPQENQDNTGPLSGPSGPAGMGPLPMGMGGPSPINFKRKSSRPRGIVGNG